MKKKKTVYSILIIILILVAIGFAFMLTRKKISISASSGVINNMEETNVSNNLEPTPDIVDTPEFESKESGQQDQDILNFENMDSESNEKLIPDTEQYIAELYTQTMYDIEKNMDNEVQGVDEKEKEEDLYIGRQIEGYHEPETDGGPDGRYAFQLQYKDTYQSNIVVIPDEIMEMDIDAFSWFKYTRNPYSFMDEIYQWVCYAIVTYYNGEVPCDYYVTISYGEDDTHNQHPDSSMIFEVQTRGEKPLNICLDMYNYKIRVEEGIKKED